jgi:signal transduction histidine kinase
LVIVLKQSKPAGTKKKFPLRVYLALGFLIFSILLIAVLWVFQTVFLDSFYRSVKTGQVKSCADSVVDNLDADELSALISDIEEQNNMTVGIFDTGSVIFTTVYTSNSNPFRRFDVEMTSVYEMYHKASDGSGEYSSIIQSGFTRRYNRKSDETISDETFPPFDGDIKNGEVKNGTRSATGDEAFPFGNINPSELPDDAGRSFDKREPALERENVQTLAYARVVSTTAGERLVIVVSEITPVSSVVDTLRYQLIIMTAVLLILSVIVAIIVAKVIAKPISDTNEKAKALANRHYDLRFSGGRYREIKELNDTLTYAASELEKVDNLQKELIANISHDLRTPLTMITGYAEIMRDLPGEVTPENIQIIIDEANRLNSLVSDLLDISRLQSGTADIRRAPFSLTASITGIFSRYTKLIESDGLNIVFEHDREVFVLGDELRMTQVIYNLINNAINYIGEDKTVLVRQTVTDGKVRIDVIDHGEGIPQEKLEYIWDRYYRVDKDHRRAVIGTGLGLSIVKNILIAHDADFGVASKLGSGSDFYFIMPIIPEN